MFPIRAIYSCILVGVCLSATTLVAEDVVSRLAEDDIGLILTTAGVKPMSDIMASPADAAEIVAGNENLDIGFLYLPELLLPLHPGPVVPAMMIVYNRARLGADAKARVAAHAENLRAIYKATVGPDAIPLSREETYRRTRLRGINLGYPEAQVEQRSRQEADGNSEPGIHVDFVPSQELSGDGFAKYDSSSDAEISALQERAERAVRVYQRALARGMSGFEILAKWNALYADPVLSAPRCSGVFAFFSRLVGWKP